MAAMGPPPPRNPSAASSSNSEPSKTITMGPPPPRIPSTSETASAPGSAGNHQEEPKADQQTEASDNSNQNFNFSEDSNDATSAVVEKQQEQRKNNVAVPYSIPEWSGAPCHHFFLEVLKEGAIIDQFDVNMKGAYMFGRVDLCDFVLEHPTISRFHAVLQFKSNGDAFLYDLGSTHGTFINKSQVKKKVYVNLHVGDVIRFGQSSRLYIFQGPSDLMPPEADLKSLRNARTRQDMQDMEASLLRAKLEATSADGISWGMQEDAVEENEDDVDEITWQTYKGQLTEKQEKTRDKVIKRLEKIAHMKKEIDAIRAKDIAQGGLTQGQQTQIARNEQRMSQIMEELENLEETLNESIRESIGARAGKLPGGKKKSGVEDENEEDYSSDDDEFYDRTQKSKKLKNVENKSVETADSLLDKKDFIMKQIKDKEKLIEDEDAQEDKKEVVEAGDALDAYMSSVSSQLVLDNKEKLRKELSALQAELDRILYLLKIADPTGDAARKRESREQMPETTMKKTPASDARSHPLAENNQELAQLSEKSQKSVPEASLVKSVVEPISELAEERKETDMDEAAATSYTITRPQWLGAVEERKTKEVEQEEPVEMQDMDQFVDYKDRQTILKLADPSQGEHGIENAAPGLIIRKRKQVEKSKDVQVKDSEQSTSSELNAEDAVALLLKHSKGYHTLDEEERPNSDDTLPSNRGRNAEKKPKRVLGPEKPYFLNDESDSSTWVPPEGQSGDGRTSLNDRFGY